MSLFLIIVLRNLAKVTATTAKSAFAGCVWSSKADFADVGAISNRWPGQLLIILA
jgi:hypothetical protein